MKPLISDHYIKRNPSPIREAQIIFSGRDDCESVEVINLAIGNISLPMHPKMIQKMKDLGHKVFEDGVVKYEPTIGNIKTRQAFLNILSSLEINTDLVECLVTDGGSAAMELMLLGVCGPSSKNPIMMLDPTYTNYVDFSKRLAIPTISYQRKLNKNGNFNPLDYDLIEQMIIKEKPLGLIIIPYDNPSGQLIEHDSLIKIVKICIKHNLWIISDEAYRSLYYQREKKASSIWSLSDKEVKGIIGRRISIESSSKVWNACGLRIGALLTDNKTFHNKATFEYTANLSANTLGQEIFGVLAEQKKDELLVWYKKQNKYYRNIIKELKMNLQKEIPGLIVSTPEAAIYFILDFKNIVDKNFDSVSFTNYCASEGKILIKGKFYTLLLAPMKSFYNNPNFGQFQMRLAVVEPPEKIKLCPKILKQLLLNYCKKNNIDISLDEIK